MEHFRELGPAVPKSSCAGLVVAEQCMEGSVQQLSLFFFVYSPDDMLTDFKKRGREGERERETSM